MLSDLIEALSKAKTEKEKEKYFRQLEKLGVDRITALVMLQLYESEVDIDE